jgi:hypothetical protein
VLAPALLIAPFAAIDRAAAECNPPSPVSGQTVTCTGPTTNQNGNTGYGTDTDTGNTITVQSNASVTGSLFGVQFQDGTVKNFGTITGGASGAGILAFGNATVTGSGAITAGANGTGILAFGDATVTGYSGKITVGDEGHGIQASRDANVTSFSGTITAGASGAGILAQGNANVTSFSGAITAGANSVGIVAGRDANVTGSGKITVGANSFGIEVGRDANVTGFSGAITAGTGGFGIRAFGNANVTGYSGTIRVGDNGFGIVANGNATVTGSGAITAGVSGSGILAFGDANVTSFSGNITVGGAGIIAQGNANVTSFSGAITTGDQGIGIEAGRDANMTGSGKITVGANGSGIQAGRDANVTGFSGTITAGTGGVGILAQGNANVRNSGTITAGTRGFGILANTANVTNFSTGTISAGANGRGIEANTATVTNSGTISAGTGGIGIVANTATVTNFGTISAGTGIQVVNGASNITTPGTIIGFGGTAIVLGGDANTLTLLPGSRIVGAIDMLNGSKDVVNFVSGGGVAQLVTLNNFTGTINTSGVGPIVHSTNQIATLDATMFGQTDRTLMDFTGGVSSLVQSRLGGAPPNGSIQAVSYGPDRTNGLIGKAPFAGYAAPTVVWTGGFGGTRTQDTTADSFHATSSVWGGLLGVDRQVRGDLLIGGFVGGGTGRLTINKSSEGVHTDYLSGGVYGRFDWASHFLDFTVQGGSAENKSNRLVLSNLALSTNGQETATARYSGWFVSPELTYGMRYAIGNGNMLTPFARVRYLAGIFDGFSEQGSAQGLSVGRRTLQDVEERGELELSKTASFGSEATIKTSVHGGVIALQRVGDTNINTVLIGQNLTFAAPGKDSTVGAVAGTGVDVTIGKSMSLFGAFEGTVMSDKSRTATAKAGLRVGF